MSGLIRWIYTRKKHTGGGGTPAPPTATSNLFPDSDFLNDYVGTTGTTTVSHGNGTIAGISGNVVTWNEGSGSEVVYVVARRDIAVVPGVQYNYSFAMSSNKANFLKYAIHVDEDGVSYYLHLDGTWNNEPYTEIFWPYNPIDGEVRYSLVTDPIPPATQATVIVENWYRNTASFTAKIGFGQLTQGTQLWTYQNTSSGTAPPPSPTPIPSGTQTKTYQEDTTTISFLPGQGLFSTSALNNPTPAAPWSNVANGMKVQWINWELLNWVNTDISASELTRMSTLLDSMIAGDVKVILRPRYSNSSANTDATKAQAIRHIQQMAPIINAKKAAIALFQIGFAGPWGECHIGIGESQNNLVRGTDSGGWLLGQIINAALANLDPSIFVGLRNLLFFGPLDQSTSMPWGLFNTLFNSANAFNGSNQSRLGFYNDCIGDGATMGSTFYTGDGMTVSHRHSVLDAFAPYVPIVGEGCGSGTATAYNTYSAVSTYFTEANQAALHASYPAWYQNWTNAQLADVCRKLGARFVVLNAVVPQSVTAGASMDVSISMKNVGYSSMSLNHEFVMVFDGPGGPFDVIALADPRAALPRAGQTSTLSLTFNAPTGLQSGKTYAIKFKMPDPDPALNASVGSMFRTFNTGMYDTATGYHDLAMSIGVV